MQVDCSTVTVSNSVKYLGVKFDATLSMTKHIAEKCQIASYKLYNIRQIRKHLSPESLKTLVNALVISHLDYGNSVLFGLPYSSIAPMQKVQNTAARVVLGLRKFDHITPAFIKLHWLPVTFRIQFKILVIVFKAIKGNAPQYIMDLLSIRTSSYSLRSANGMNLLIPMSRYKSFGDRAFSVAAPKLWNQLPHSVKLTSELSVFIIWGKFDLLGTIAC